MCYNVQSYNILCYCYCCFTTLQHIIKKTCVSRTLSNITNNKSVIEKHILFTYKFENCVCVLIVQ